MKLYLIQISATYGSNKFCFLPYSVGSLWSYAVSNEVVKQNYFLEDIFFLREDFDKVLNRMDNPSVVAFSLYVWNENYTLSLAKKIKEKFKNCLIIVGGPSVPKNSENFLKAYSFIDLCVHNEGEDSFKNILIENLKDSPNFSIDNVSYIENDKYFKGGFSRITNLDNIPSPYTTGVFDNIIKDNPEIVFNMILETNRGCPFSCTFCNWGTLTTQKIKQLGLKRVFEEIEWCADNKIEFIEIADANFGIFIKRDNLIVYKMIDVKNKKGHLKLISASWNKNSKHETLSLAKKLFDNGLYRRFTVSIQTLDEKSLIAIKRKNTDGSNFDYMLKTAKDYGLPVSTETIIGLPEETYKSYMNTLDFVLNNHLPYQYNILQILDNSEMSDQFYIEKYELDIIRTESSFSDDFAKEYQNICVGTKSLPRKNFEKLLLFQWFVFSFHDFHITHVVAHTLKKVFNIKITDFYKDFLEHILEDSTHCIHDDILKFKNPIKNNQMAFLENSYNKHQSNLLSKVFNNQQFYSNLKNFCIDRYGCDSLLIDDAISIQINSYNYQRFSEEYTLNFNTNLHDHLVSGAPLTFKQKKYKIIKDSIPSNILDWYSHFRYTSWGDSWKSTIYEI